MRRSPELRPTGWDALLALCVALLALGLAFFQWRGGSAEALTAVVAIDGREVDRFAPSDLVGGARTYSNNGYTLEVAWGLRGEAPTLDSRQSGAEEGILVAHADCPTQDCVRTGVITRSGQSIVCLPARIIVRLEGGAEDDGVDAVLG